jgi:hypothetical protein
MDNRFRKERYSWGAGDITVEPSAEPKIEERDGQWYVVTGDRKSGPFESREAAAASAGRR